MPEHQPTLPDTDQMARRTAQLIPAEHRATAAMLMTAVMTILAEGRPASMQEVSAATGHPTDQIPAWFPPDEGAEWDTEGRLVGQGMTLNPTTHRVDVDGHTLYAWCAADALGMLPAIGRSVQITSPCRATGRTVAVAVNPDGVEDVQPAAAVVSVVVVGSPDDPRGTMCDFGHFFVSADDASGWLDEHRPDTTLLSVPDAFQYALRTMQLLLHPDHVGDTP